MLPIYIDVEVDYGKYNKFHIVDSARPAVAARVLSDPEWIGTRDTDAVFRVPFERLGITRVPRDRGQHMDIVNRMILYACAVSLHVPRFNPSDFQEVIARESLMRRFERNVAELPAGVSAIIRQLYEEACQFEESRNTDWFDYFGRLRLSMNRSTQEALPKDWDLFACPECVQLSTIYSPGVWNLENMKNGVWEALLYHYVPYSYELADKIWMEHGFYVTTAMDSYWTSDIIPILEAFCKTPGRGGYEGNIKAAWPCPGDTMRLSYNNTVRFILLEDIRRLMGLPCGVYQKFPSGAVIESGLSPSDAGPAFGRIPITE